MSSKMGKIIAFVGAILAVVAILMMFAPAIVPKEGKSNDMTGLKLAFGAKEDDVRILDASIMILAYGLLIAGIIFTILSMLGNGGKFALFAAAICFAVAAVMFFLSLQLVDFAYGAEQDFKADINESVRKAWKLGIGAIVSGATAAVAAVAVIIASFAKDAPERPAMAMPPRRY